MCVVTLLVAGCGDEEVVENKPAKEEPTEDTTREVSTDEIEERDGVSYIKGETEPFMGKEITHYPDGSKRSEISHQEGKKHGKWIGYSKDGSKSSESIWEDGKKISSKKF